MKKANEDILKTQNSSETGKGSANTMEAIVDQSKKFSISKSIDVHLIFMGAIIILAAMGVYLNYNISLNLSSTQTRMITISENFRMQQDQLNKLNQLMLQMNTANNGQSQEFLSKIDKLSSSLEEQIAKVQQLSTSQYTELSKTIEEQQKSLAVLSSKYDQLDKSVSNYTDVNNRYIEQLNLLKKKIDEISPVEAEQ
jgi:septal ring factor EnvC (AmiA/AmiB activator)